MKRLFIMLLALGLSGGLFARQRDHEAARLSRAGQVIQTVMTLRDPAIPAQLVTRALCIGVIPSALSIELGLGAHFGRGALVCRLKGGRGWSAPWMFTVGGATYGLIPQGESSDVVFLVMTPRCQRRLMTSCVRLGADVSAVAGPLAAKSGSAPISLLHSDLIAYSISQGKFSGASLEGVILKPDDDANLRLYGHHVDPDEVLTDATFRVPPAAKSLEQMLARFCSPPDTAAIEKN